MCIHRTDGETSRLINFASVRRLLASLAASESQQCLRKPMTTETETQIPPLNMRNRSQDSTQELVERLEAVLVELERLPLPPGRAGSSLLDTFEIMDRARKRARTAAKAMLVKEPSALPGWRVSRSGAPDQLERLGLALTVIRRHRRRQSVRLFQRQ